MILVFDLDDTLYDEIDFVKSGFMQISNFLQNREYYEFMLNDFQKNGSGKIFNNLISEYSLNIALQELVDIYRFHKPDISLSQKTAGLLEKLDFAKALITDGHFITQKNKFLALGLDKYIEYPIYTHFYHTKKPEPKAFKMVMDRYKNEKYCYISDNPKKDFFAPRKLGWKTIRYKNPNGIYRNFKNNAEFEIDDLEKIGSFI